MTTSANLADFRIGGEININRMGFGAMRLVGELGFGPPADRDRSLTVLRRAVEIGVNFIDTADAYGPYLNEHQIADALRPYPKSLVVATKGANLRFYQRDKFEVNSTPAYLREALEGSLRRLKLETIDLYQVHRLDGETPVEDTIGALHDLRREGKLRHVGLSEVGVETLKRARAVGPIATVQNRYNLEKRRHDDVLAYCEEHGIGFIPWFPLGSGTLADGGAALDEIGARLNATPAQVALAWLLARSPNMILIPGTSSIAHLEQNVAAAAIRLDAADFARLNALTAPVGA